MTSISMLFNLIWANILISTSHRLYSYHHRPSKKQNMQSSIVNVAECRKRLKKGENREGVQLVASWIYQQLPPEVYLLNIWFKAVQSEVLAQYIYLLKKVQSVTVRSIAANKNLVRHINFLLTLLLDLEIHFIATNTLN